MTQMRDRRVIAAGLAFCLLLGAVAQHLFARQRPAFSDGVILYAVAVILFLLLNAWADKATPAEFQEESPLSPTVYLWNRPIRIALVVLSLGVVYLAVRIIRSNPPTYWSAFYLWLAAIVLFVAAFVHRLSFGGWAALRAKIRANRWEILAVAGLLLVGALLRGISLDTIPPNIGGDEGSQGLEGIDFMTGAKANMFDTGWLGVPSLSFLWHALWYKLLGVSVTTLRLPWMFVGTMTLLVFYLLVRRLFGMRLALISTFFLTMYNYHIHYSRLGSNQVADGLFMALVLYFLTRGLSTRRPLDFALAGVTLGSSIYFYAGARLTFVVVAAYLIVLGLLNDRRLQGSTGNLAILAGAAFVVALPLGNFYYQHPDDFNARLNIQCL